MKLLKGIRNVSICKLPRADNTATDAFAKLAKELACPDNESVSIKVQN